MDRRRVGAAVAAVAVAVLAAGCGGAPWEGTGLDEAGWSACSSFGDAISGQGGGYGLTGAERQPVVSGAAGAATSAAPGLSGAAGYVQRSASGPVGSWRAALDSFAGRCQALGWHP